MCSPTAKEFYDEWPDMLEEAQFYPPPGWRPMLWKVFEMLEGQGTRDMPEYPLRVQEIKEKFGGLRLYYIGGSEAQARIVDAAELATCWTCQGCGTTRGVTRPCRSPEDMWIYTECEPCRQRRRADR